jgi:hypothetical protein
MSKLNIGVDYHDTLSYNPKFFQNFFSAWEAFGNIYIVTGTPASKLEEVKDELEVLGFPRDSYTDILPGYEYDKKNMNSSHFLRMRDHKLALIKKYEIGVFFDDNPFYVEHVRNHGVTVFQTILDDEYIERFSKINPFFTCNLQEKQFEFLGNLGNIEKPKSE